MSKTKTASRSRAPRGKAKRGARRSGVNGRSNGRAKKAGTGLLARKEKKDAALKEWRDIYQQMQVTTARDKAKAAKKDGAKVSGYELEVALTDLLRSYIDDEVRAYHIANELWRGILGYIRDALIEGRPVNLHNLGTLRPYIKKSARYRHPETGQIRRSPKRWHVSLALSPGLKEDLQE